MRTMRKYAFTRDWKLRKKFSLILSASILLIAAVTAWSIGNLIQAYNERLNELLAYTMRLTSGQISGKMDDAATTLRQITEDSQIQGYLSHIKDSERIYSGDYNELSYKLQDYYQRNRKTGNVTNIIVHTSDYTFFTNTSAAVRPPDDILESLYVRALEEEGRTTCVTDWLDTYGVFFVKEIKRISNARLDTLGIAIQQIDMESILQKSALLGEYDELCLGVLPEQSEQPLLAVESRRGEMPKITDRDDGWSVERIGGKSYFIMLQQDASYPWRYVYFLPYGSVLTTIYQSMLTNIAVYVLGTLAAFALCDVLIRSITKRFSVLTQKMDDFVRYIPQMNLPDCGYPGDDADLGLDEIGTLNSHFITMAKEVDGLIQTVYADKILAREAQIKILESQINPHFLYNVLSTIDWTAKKYGAQEISDQVESLSSLLRAAMDSSTGLIPLSDEISLVRAYVMLQKARFQERMQFSIRIEDEALYDARIPRSSLQPLVDNAVRYGVEHSTQPCDILLEVEGAGDDLVLRVKNTNSSFEEGTLEKLENGQLAPHGNGIGLLNIRSRLMLAFGGRAEMTLENKCGYATVQITVPITIKTESSGGDANAEADDRG